MRARVLHAVHACGARMHVSLWSQDGFIIVAKTNPNVVSSQLALFLMLFSASFINFMSFFLLLLLFMGHLFWLCERGQNPQFRSFYSQVTVALFQHTD
jgi:hypothetical protein